MPINIPETLPAAGVLRSENIFIMTQSRAEHQDIRPLEICILNLMPKKIETETQLLRLLGNSSLQVHITLLTTATYSPKNISEEHLLEFYTTFDRVKERYFDGLVITGAPVELLEFEQVQYWKELCSIMQWSRQHVYSTMHICWAAQAGMYFHYGIPKLRLPAKLSGIYRHRVTSRNSPLVRGFDDSFFAPHSRNTGNDMALVANSPLDSIAQSDDAGLYLAASANLRQVFVTGHSEYDAMTLHAEFERDRAAGLDPGLPLNYYEGDDPSGDVTVLWRAHAHLLFSNWLNYAVYQQTPYERCQIAQLE